jgi:C1q domain
MSFGNNPGGIQRVALICRGKTAQSVNSWTTLTNWTEVQDPTNSFDPIAGIFTAPRAGTYNFSLGDGLQNPIGSYIGLSITKNGTQFYNILPTINSASIQYLGLSGLVELAAGDTVSPRAYHASAASDAPSASNSWFTITEINTNF